MKKAVYFAKLKGIRDAVPHAQQANFDLQFAIKEKNPSVALILSLLLGALGVDRFYLGHIKLGFLKLFTLIVVTVGTIENWYTIINGLPTYSIFWSFLRLCFLVWIIVDWFLAMGAARHANIGIAKEIQCFTGALQESTADTNFICAIADKNGDHLRDANVATSSKKRPLCKRIVYLSVICITIFTIIICLIRGEDRSPDITAPSSSNKGYKLSSREQIVLNILLKDEAKVFVSDANKTMLKMELITSSSDKIAQAYNENQVAADQRFFNKTVFISGVIQSINSGIGNTPYLSLRGFNEFLPPQAHFENGNVQKISKLKKGQKIYLVCRGNGSIIGAPMFNQCQFAQDYIENRVSSIKTEINHFLHGHRVQSRAVAPLSFLVIVWTRMLPDNSPCFVGDEKKCLIEIKALSDKKVNGKSIMMKKASEAATELKSLGVPFHREDFSNVGN